MEIIQLDGYTETEKLQIAKRHLIPRQLSAHGLREDEVTFIDDAIYKIIQDYTRETGVRNLDRHLAAICRKSIVHLNEKDWSHVVITAKMVREYLKKERFTAEKSEVISLPGIATGLAVTSVGGDILYIEGMKDYSRIHTPDQRIMTLQDEGRVDILLNSQVTRIEDGRAIIDAREGDETRAVTLAADYVFILDPWWNPTAEQQAIARAHRIGDQASDHHSHRRNDGEGSDRIEPASATRCQKAQDGARCDGSHDHRDRPPHAVGLPHPDGFGSSRGRAQRERDSASGAAASLASCSWAQMGQASASLAIS